MTLGATTLLHEAYLDISGRHGVAFPDRNRFLAYASRAMRGLIIDYMRRRSAQKRGGEFTFTTLTDHVDAPAYIGPDLDALNLALETLESLEPGLAELVDLRFFCGLSLVEIASLRAVSERTVQRDWAKARVLLHRFVEDGLS